MSFIRKVVKYRDADGRKVRRVVKHSDDGITVRQMGNICEVVSFITQADSTIEIVQRSLVEEIAIEQEDPKYATFKKIGTIDLDTLKD